MAVIQATTGTGHPCCMDLFSHIAGWAVFALYLAGTLMLLQAARSPDQGVPRTGEGEGHGTGKAYRWPVLVAISLHALLVYTSVFHANGFTIGLFHALSLTSLLIVILLMAVTLSQPLQVLGIMLFPAAGICALAGTLGTAEHHTIPLNLQWHVFISVMAYGMLSLAATQAVALAIQTHYLRTLRPPGVFATLPPINQMEKLLFQMIGSGFVLLSLSLLTGMLFLEDLFAQHLVHKTVLSLLAWLIFGTLLTGRWLRGWRGRAALTYTISGLIFLLVGYFGSKLVLEFILAPGTMIH